MTADRPRIARAEFAALLALLAIAFGLRAWRVIEQGIGHYDEGVYALSAIGIADPTQPLRLFPGENRFSPPVYFSLVGVVARIFGVAIDAAAIGLNVVLGTLTVLATWWIGRRWFGVAAGLGAAALLALNEFHIALSRTALTDVAFALFFSIALFALVEAFERRSVTLSILAGIAVGLAWNTKYHGWLALAVTGVSLVPSMATSLRERNRDWLRSLGLWGIAALVAGVCYVPWFLYVEAQPGGYRGLAAYQSTMLRGAWHDNAFRQALQQLFFEGPFSRASLIVALLTVIAASRPRLGFSRSLALMLVVLAACALMVGGSATIAILAVVGIVELLRRKLELPTLVLGVVIALWLVITPIYHPYARLVLPFTIMTCLAAGAWIATRAQRFGESSSAPRGVLAAAVGVVIVAGLSLALPDPSQPWKLRRNTRDAAQAMLEKIPPGSRVIVLAEPNLSHYLHVQGRPAFESVDLRDAVATLEAVKEPLFVVTGIYASRTKTTQELETRFGAQFQLLDTLPFEPTDIRLLDDFNPRRAYAFHQRPTREYDLKLYRFEPR